MLIWSHGYNPVKYFQQECFVVDLMYTTIASQHETPYFVPLLMITCLLSLN